MAFGGVGASQGDNHGLLLAVQLGRSPAAGLLGEGSVQAFADPALAEAFDGGQPSPGGLDNLFVGPALVGQEQDLVPPPLSPCERVAFQAVGQVSPLLVGQVDDSSLAQGSSPCWGEDSLRNAAAPVEISGGFH